MRRFLIRVLTVFAVGVFLVFVVSVAMHFAFGMDIMLDGGGRPRIRFIQSADEQARAIEAHREAQRASAASAAATPAPPGPAPVETAPPAVVPDTATTAPTEDWTGFRGPARDAVYRERATLTNWPVDGLTPMWKQPAGGGYASFAIAKGRAFTIEQRGSQEVAAAYDVRTGRELWKSVWDALFQEFMGGDGPRATPVWADGLVYVLGAAGEFRCLDEATGKTVWRTNILQDNGASNLQWGMSASPLIVDDTVVVLPGGSGGRSVVAYNRRTGARVWSAHNDQAGYAAAMLATLAGVRQILVFTASRMMGITPNEGKLLWEYPWRTQYDINASQPIVIGENRVFISSGYGTGAAVIEIVRSAARGAGRDSDLTVREVWRNVRMKNRFNSSVLHDGHIYGFDESIFACLDAATGDLKWKGGRYGYGQVLLASGHLIVLTEEGDLVLVRATPDKHDEIARFSALEGKTWNVPAMSGGVLLVRNLSEMAAFNLAVR